MLTLEELKMEVKVDKMQTHLKQKEVKPLYITFSHYREVEKQENQFLNLNVVRLLTEIL